MYHEPDYPENLSAESIDLIDKLLQKEPKERMGAYAEIVMNHIWFDCINWDSLINKSVSPPFKPDLLEDGLNYFDEEFTSEDIKYHLQSFSPEVSSKSQSDQFSDFDFQVSENNDEN